MDVITTSVPTFEEVLASLRATRHQLYLWSASVPDSRLLGITMTAWDAFQEASKLMGDILHMEATLIFQLRLDEGVDDRVKR